MGQVLHNIATTALAIRKEIQERPEKVWKSISKIFSPLFYASEASVQNTISALARIIVGLLSVASQRDKDLS